MIRLYIYCMIKYFHKRVVFKMGPNWNYPNILKKNSSLKKKILEISCFIFSCFSVQKALYISKVVIFCRLSILSYLLIGTGTIISLSLEQKISGTAILIDLYFINIFLGFSRVVFSGTLVTTYTEPPLEIIIRFSYV